MGKTEKLLELQEEAIKGFAAIGQYMAVCDGLTHEAVNAFHVLRDWFFTGEE